MGFLPMRVARYQKHAATVSELAEKSQDKSGVGDVVYLESFVITVNCQLGISHEIPVVGIADDGGDGWVLAASNTGGDQVAKCMRVMEAG